MHSISTVYVILVLEGTLLHLAAVIFHHQIRDGAEGTLAAEAALAHGDTLENAPHGRERHIVVPVDEKTVEIEGLFAHAARAEALAGLPVRGQLLAAERGVSKA